MNARQELVEHIGGLAVEFVSVAYSTDYGETVLRIKGTLEEVLPKLNFEYDNGYGSQELRGCIWYKDGTWSERGEYDGSEWWEHKYCPDRDEDMW